MKHKYPKYIFSAFETQSNISWVFWAMSFDDITGSLTQSPLCSVMGHRNYNFACRKLGILSVEIFCFRWSKKTEKLKDFIKGKKIGGLVLIVVCTTAIIIHVFICFSAVQIYDLLYIHLHPLPSTGILQTHNVSGSQLVW